MILKPRTNAGTSLPELMISAVLLAAFFGSIFEVNAVCLRLVNGSKENVAAIQGVQDRLETLRNLSYTDLTNAAYLKDNILGAPSNVSDFAKKVVEEVTVTSFDTDSATPATVGPGIKLVRPAGATATPTLVSSDTTVPDAKAVLVKVKYTWNMTFGGRQRVEETASIVSAGVKK
jgi:hypothetical protein